MVSVRKKTRIELTNSKKHATGEFIINWRGGGTLWESTVTGKRNPSKALNGGEKTKLSQAYVESRLTCGNLKGRTSGKAKGG